ncbi:inositol monophosphatase family protein [Leptolyngbya sp. CCY15150]|uniref:3'(2'),5'-bisphosphate nucleotidase CysQ family protein n=1 Tax=Leptolyngbya sp. CCY15150 TaxID=2767772 RepID=UPI00194F9003|nr:inositol monophosphatase family protein [Leptolyngbya sp. CCY15150]
MHYLSVDQAQTIRWLVRDCGQQAKQLAAEQFQVFEKGKDDYVTSVDRLLDQRLSEAFRAMFPQDGLVTEENSASRQVFHGSHRRLWCIDPIDGTDDFIHGRLYYSVMVGLLEGSQPTAGWIYAPTLDRLYYGGLGWGVFQAGGDRLPEAITPIEPPLSESNCPMLIGDKDRRQFGDAIQRAVPAAQFRTLGSFGLKVMEVVSGRAGLYLYLNRRVKLWDTVGPLALAQAAGLTCCDLDGQPIGFTADCLDPETLAHHQTILVGWPHYIEALRSPIRQAVLSQSEESWSIAR